MMIKIDELMHAFIQRHCDFNKEIILTNHFHADWEADIFIIDNEGFSHEIEIKYSKADFKNDFKKCYTNAAGEKFLKHDKISCGDYICNHFSFLLPMGMLKKTEVPSHCGIIEFYHNPDHWKTDFHIVRAPAKIHEENYWNLVDKEHFLRRLSMNLVTRKFQMKGKLEELIFSQNFF